tara:strand:+ start:104 stop:214 length:111 start_codon:yes stop_codon:yes gene_type:complete
MTTQNEKVILITSSRNGRIKTKSAYKHTRKTTKHEK